MAWPSPLHTGQLSAIRWVRGKGQCRYESAEAAREVSEVPTGAGKHKSCSFQYTLSGRATFLGWPNEASCLIRLDICPKKGSFLIRSKANCNFYDFPHRLGPQKLHPRVPTICESTACPRDTSWLRQMTSRMQISCARPSGNSYTCVYQTSASSYAHNVTAKPDQTFSAC
jgi:hypothetical protein